MNFREQIKFKNPGIKQKKEDVLENLYALFESRYLDVLIDPDFQGVNKLFVLSFENENGWESYRQYYIPTVEKSDYNVKIDG